MLFLLIVLSPSSCGAAVNADELSGPDLYNSRPFLDAWAYSVFRKPCCTCGCWTDEGGKPCYKHFTRITYAILSILILFPIILICVSFFRIPSLLPALQMMMQKV
ncbi:hypothetical protein BLNAU_11060 [Blattamonas nauphoetae]|uniref:Uncharacterized protein n=1 Tax=Blattamonas nauphoetae TaxID=2049346 RepID=A0ABQ9XRB0_9EUKA|nr:hypothetical protein BLNAU_11060 [Blattamonas nauphoetae]